MSFTTVEDFSNNLNLFSNESDLVQVRSLSSRSAKPAKGGGILDDLLSSNEGGKHEYDWLLTPPETSLISSSKGKEYQPKSVAQRRNPSVRSSSTNRTSRLSVFQSESNHISRPTRSSSVTRPSISTNRNSNILNTSSASVSSYIRPATPTNRHPPSAARPSTATSRPTSSRSRPSTTTTDRIIRPTPTNRSPTPSFNNRRVGPTFRPSSPVSRAISLPDFPNETPPNLRTCLPERPVSAGRCRPGAAMTVKGNVDIINTKRHPSPVAVRGRVAEQEPHGRGRGRLHAVDSVTRKPVKVLSSESGTGFVRSISKKSPDTPLKHMDLRTGGMRPLPRSTLFPHSIRSSQPSSASNNLNSKNGTLKNGYTDNKVKPVTIEHKSLYSSKLGRVDIYESLRYDSILLKEDLKNTSWLHGADEKTDQGLLFDNGFESLPEPFAP